MKKFFTYCFITSVALISLSGCGKDESKTPVVRKAETHAYWTMERIGAGEIDKAATGIFIPKDVKDKAAFMKSVKSALASQKAQFDAKGGFEKVTLKNMTVNLLIKVKNEPQPIERSVNIVKIGGNDYRIVIPENQLK